MSHQRRAGLPGAWRPRLCLCRPQILTSLQELQPGSLDGYVQCGPAALSHCWFCYSLFFF